MTRYFFTFFTLVFSLTLFANTPNQDKPTLSQQFQVVREQAEVIESFRMLKAYQVENFWKSVQDTLKQTQEATSELKASLVNKDKEIKALNNTIHQQEMAAADVEFASTHIAVLGMDVSKSSFKKTVAITFIVLLLLAGLALWAFRVSYQSTRESRSLYDEVSAEFDAYKHRMVEKEVKLLRELQDHRNKMMELQSA